MVATRSVGLDAANSRLSGSWVSATRFRPSKICSCSRLASREDGKAWDQDWAVVSAPAEAVQELSWRVRPRVQLDRLPAGLEAFWDAEQPWLRNPDVSG